jgi:GNAT superfamily N-acetyltransferase
MFGPTGTDEKARGLGVGAALLVASLAAMREAGYAYAVIGGVGEHVSGFYQKVVAAVEIADSEPGIYRDRIGPGHK